MKTLYIERSTGDARDGAWVEKLDVDGVGRIVVGTGPGSFAGVRSALAFAKGFSIGSGCSVFGVPSPCASAARLLETERFVAVVGDARRGKIWVALFDGYMPAGDVFQVDAGHLASAVPEKYKVVTPDAGRIGEMLSSLFGPRYAGAAVTDAEGLEKFVAECPSVLDPAPLPLYLNPAVRP